MKVIILVLINLLSFPAYYLAQQKLSEADAVLIAEAINFQDEVGRQIWKEWELPELPIVFKVGGFDYFINHSNAPKESEIYYDKTLNDSVAVLPSVDSNMYQATFPLNGIWTVVISKPDSSYDLGLWLLKFTHESFHILQSRINRVRIVNPFVNEYAGFHELNFPFDYEKEVLSSSLRVEAEGIFNVVSTEDSVSPGVIAKLFNSYQDILKYVLEDSLQYRYKQWQEWMEGISRYTEREAARLAKNFHYKLSKKFTNLHPEVNFDRTWETSYQEMINPVRFIGEGVNGRVMFYYSGMGKGYLLDKIFPGWKNKYFKFNLDDIIQQAGT